MADPLAFLADELASLEQRGLRRTSPAASDPARPSFCSNDYLGLAAEPAPPCPSGAGASRLIAGERVEHRTLERALARWLGVEDALVFSSGYAANVGALSALAGPSDLVVSDALNHASIIDGARLSRARVVVTGHNDVEAVRDALRSGPRRRAFVVVESYYSMDADGPDLAALRAACDEGDAALVVDEAHALGVLGPGGRGRAAEAGAAPDVLVGTLGKALGSQGAFVAGRAELRDWLWNRARSFVFSTGLAPASAAAALRSLERLIAEPELPQRVLARAATMREALARGGIAVAPSVARAGGGAGTATVVGFGHVVPVVAGSAERALRLAAGLRERGLDVPAIRPPTVPEGSARVRLTVTARHRDAAVRDAAGAVVDAVRALAP